MPQDAGTIYSEVRVELQSLKADINTVKGQFTRIETDANKSSGSVNRTWSSAFKGIAATAASTLATIGFARLGKELISAASDAEETSNKFNVVFRDISDEANSLADNLQENFGLSSRAAQQLLADTGDLLTGFGFTQEEALSLSNEVNKLAVDLASFTNYAGGAEGASAALTKALLGEREAIKELGIAITESDLKAFAEEQGLVYNELDRTSKAWLTYELAVRQSQNAIGDFARSQDSFANQQRILQAQLEDLKAELGEELLPLAVEFLGILIDLTKGFTELGDGAQKTILGFGAFAAAAIPVANTASQLAGGLKNITSSLGLFSKGATAAGTAASGAGGSISGLTAVLAGPAGFIAAVVAGAAGLALLLREIGEATQKADAARELGGAFDNFGEEAAGAGSDVATLNQNLNTFFARRVGVGGTVSSFQDLSTEIDAASARLGVSKGLIIDFLKDANVLSREQTGWLQGIEQIYIRQAEYVLGVAGAEEISAQRVEERRQAEEALAEQEEQSAADRLKASELEFDWYTRLLKQREDSIALLEIEKQQAIQKAEEVGASTAAIEEYYANERLAIEQEAQDKKDELQREYVEKLEEFNAERAEDELELIELQRERALEEAERNEEAIAAINEYYNILRDTTAYDAQQAKAEELRQKVVNVFNMIGGAASSLFNALIALSDAQTNNRLADLDRQLNRELADKGLLEETEIQRLERELAEAKERGDEETADEKRQAIERQKIVDEFEEKKRRLEYEGALASWKLTLANAVATAPLAIINAINTGYGVGGPLGLVLGPALGVAAAAATGIQIAAISAAKPQKASFASGGFVPGDNYGADGVDVRLAPRELVLNGQQQARLLGMANGTASSDTSGGSTPLQFYFNTELIAEAIVDLINNRRFTIEPGSIRESR